MLMLMVSSGDSKKDFAVFRCFSFLVLWEM